MSVVSGICFYAPSYKRPKDAFTQKKFPSVTYVVAQDESELYEKEGHRIKVAPNSAQGNLCRIRNWILDNAESSRVIIVDDDLSGFARYENGKSVKMNHEQWVEFCEMGFAFAEQINAKFWGVNLLPDKGAYREYSPFSFKSTIGGPFQCFNNLDLRYDENLPLKEDYDLSLQVLQKYHMTLRFNAYHYICKQHINPGGCASYRTMQKEKEQFDLLQKKWGANIVKSDRKKDGGYDINPIIKVPIGGI